ncbi:MAG: hypothetical protein EHM77_01460 [Planctomycetaceae bacterium]|nr:MAG: hypothetical protein EHM77_01460 [Planctomycetaceae bacterium]
MPDGHGNLAIESRIGWGKRQFDIGGQELITELVIPLMHRGPSHRVGRDPVGPNDQQGIGSDSIAIFLHRVIADRAEGGIEGVGHARNGFQMLIRDVPVARLQVDAIGPAFDVDRPTVGTIRPLVRDDHDPRGLRLQFLRELRDRGLFSFDIRQHLVEGLLNLNHVPVFFE